MADQVAAERWRPIPDWPYEVSDMGRVRRTVLYRSSKPDGSVRPTPTPGGYLTVKLFQGNVGKTFSVHSLVARAFCGAKPSPHHQVAHFDGDKTNNQASNLRWATPKENNDDKIRHGTTAKGTGHAASKLTESDVAYIRSVKIPSRVIAKQFGVHQSTVVDARNGKTWKHVS